MSFYSAEWSIEGAIPKRIRLALSCLFTGLEVAVG